MRAIFLKGFEIVEISSCFGGIQQLGNFLNRSHLSF